MIDTYFDRCDYANWRTAQHQAVQRRLAEDPRYYNGQIYVTVAARNAAEARETLRVALINTVWQHRVEIARGTMLGSPASAFRADGRRK